VAQAQTAGATLADDQKSADAIRDQLLAFAKAEFARTVKGKQIPYNKIIGRKVPVKVLKKDDFDAQYAKFTARLDAEDLAALVRYRTRFVERTLRRLKEMGVELRGTYPARLTPTTVIDPLDAGSFLPSSMRTTQSRVAGFFDAHEDTLFIIAGSVDQDVIGHELCHAYTHPTWTEVQIKISAFGHAVEVNQIDEGVTSEMANIILLRLLRQQAGGSPAGSPNGYVGYPREVQARAETFLNAVDGQTTPGNVTMEAYFGGHIDVKIDEKKLEDSVLTLGKKKIKLGTVVS
jgi:hypothetical protein